jgi:predicted transcriptional regulator
MRMPETKTINPLLVAQIVRNYVAHNGVVPADLPNLIATVHRSLAELGQPAEGPALNSSVAINRSFSRDAVICLDCGWRGKMLRRHLTAAHGLSSEDYRARWSLKETHPLVAPSYAERRSAIAKELGLGHRRTVAPEPSAAALKRRGRPRNATPAYPRP